MSIKGSISICNLEILKKIKIYLLYFLLSVLSTRTHSWYLQSKSTTKSALASLLSFIFLLRTLKKWIWQKKESLYWQLRKQARPTNYNSKWQSIAFCALWKRHKDCATHHRSVVLPPELSLHSLQEEVTNSCCELTGSMSVTGDHLHSTAMGTPTEIDTGAHKD